MQDNTGASGENAQSGPQFTVHNVYTKDISFEAPNTPDIFGKPWEPKLDFDMQMGSKALQGEEGAFEVTLSLTVSVKLPEKEGGEAVQTAFLAEVKQAGIFIVAGFENEQRDHILSTTAPGLLFPYAREVVSNLVTKGSFPQLILPPMNFDAMYQQHLKEKTQQTTKAEVAANE